MNFKKSIYLCTSILMMLGIAAPAASANVHHAGPRAQRVINHLKAHQANEKRLTQRKVNHNYSIQRINRINHHQRVHQANLARDNAQGINRIKNNLKRYQRIQHHVLAHQNNLQRINHRIQHLQKHPRRHNARYVAMINRLNHDKTRLINIIETNQHGMLRLAKKVNSERHAINLIKHPNIARQAPRHISSNVSNHHNLNDHYDNYYYDAADGSFYSNNNGKINRGDAHAIDNNGNLSGHASLNGKLYRINRQDLNQINQDFNRTEAHINAFNSQINYFDHQLNHEIQNDFNEF